MEESLEINKEYNFQILSIEPKEHRMSLKLEKMEEKVKKQKKEEKILDHKPETL